MLNPALHRIERQYSASSETVARTLTAFFITAPDLAFDRRSAGQHVRQEKGAAGIAIGCPLAACWSTASGPWRSSGRRR
jgi:hypothetical protein